MLPFLITVHDRHRRLVCIAFKVHLQVSKIICLLYILFRKEKHEFSNVQPASVLYALIGSVTTRIVTMSFGKVSILFLYCYQLHYI